MDKKCILKNSGASEVYILLEYLEILKFILVTYRKAVQMQVSNSSV